MTVDKSKYSNIEFFSEFSYIRPITRVVISTVDNGFGYQQFASTVAIPASVTTRPPLIEYYLEYPSGYFEKLSSTSGVQAGTDGNNITVNGFINDDWNGTAVGYVHCVIYDRAS